MDELLTLDKLEPGKKAVIVSVGGEGSLRRRLLDLGLTPKTTVMVRKVAPLGDPIELHLRNYELTIRKADAGRIEVFPLEEDSCSFCGSCDSCRKMASRHGNRHSFHRNKENNHNREE